MSAVLRKVVMKKAIQKIFDWIDKYSMNIAFTLIVMMYIIVTVFCLFHQIKKCVYGTEI